jgi:hypothetical protein
MSNLLNSIKADLLDRRLRAGVLALGVALTAALAYAVLGGGGGGGSTASPAARPGAGSATPAAGIAVSQAPSSPGEAIAETTNGLSHQRKGLARDPFTPLPGATSTTTTAATPGSSSAGSGSSTSGSGSSTSGSGSSTSGSGSSGKAQSGSSSQGGATTPAPASKPAKPTTPAPVYHVAVLFGAVPAGTPPQNAQLTPYENLAPHTSLPSSSQRLVVFKGAAAGGKSATFTLAGEVILHGNGACVPSASQCEAIDLRPGQSEELEYVLPSGQAIIYQLEVVSISSSKASTARAHASRRRSHRAHASRRSDD